MVLRGVGFRATAATDCRPFVKHSDFSLSLSLPNERVFGGRTKPQLECSTPYPAPGDNRQRQRIHRTLSLDEASASGLRARRAYSGRSRKPLGEAVRVDPVETVERTPIRIG